jgi:integrase/recombinase XerD
MGMSVQLSFPPLACDHPDGEGTGSRSELVREGYLATVEHDSTRRVYGNDLSVYWRWCEERGLDPLDATSGDIEEWCAFQVHEQPDLRRDPRNPAPSGGRSDSLVRRRLGAVSRLMRFAIDAGERRAPNPVPLERPRAQDPDAEARWLTAREVAAILDTADAHGPLPHALCSLLFLYAQPGTQTGLIAREDVDADESSPRIRLAMRCEHRVNVPLQGRTLNAVRALLARPGEPHWPLIPTHQYPAIALPSKEVGRLVTRVAADAGIPEVTLIVVRHTFCALAREAHFSEDAIKRYTGARWGAAKQWQQHQPPSPPQAIESLIQGARTPAQPTSAAHQPARLPVLVG